MANNWDYEQTSPPLSDTKVDRLADVPTGQIDQLPSLSIDIPDSQIIRNLNNRIDDSIGYWDDPSGYNLRQSRNESMRFYLGKQNDVRSLYRFQTPYVENQIYIAEQSIVAYLTAQNPQPEVSPAQNNQQSKIFAADLEKVLMVGSLLLVLVVELLNSSVEAAIDRISFEHHDLSKRAKDFGSAEVMLTLLFALLVWLTIAIPLIVSFN
jgi:diacylglycerol kinase (ATP)